MSSIYYYHQIAFGRVSMAAKPSVFRADNPLPPDLSTDRSIYRRGGAGGSSSASRRRDLVFVVNPRGLSLSLSLSLSRSLELIRSSNFVGFGEMD